MAITVSACIICKNEARRIGAALASLAWCEDIVVIDSGSTDGTVELAQNHPTKPRVLHHEWMGYGPQREFAVSQCRHEWVLMLDADEECDEHLSTEIRGLTEEQVAKVGIFRMPRRNHMAGRHIICWGPDYQARLIHRARVEWDCTRIPERRRCKAGYQTRQLRGCLLHDRHGEFKRVDLINGPQMAEYADELSEYLRTKGTRATWVNLAFRPLVAFVKYYVIKGAFLQGRFGLVIAYKSTVGVMLKYSALYAKEELEGKGGK